MRRFRPTLPVIVLDLLINDGPRGAKLSPLRGLVIAQSEAPRRLASRPHGLYGRALSRPGRPHPKVIEMAKINVAEPRRRTRWRRDGAHHVALHQEQADPALSRHRPEIVRPRDGEPRRLT